MLRLIRCDCHSILSFEHCLIDLLTLRVITQCRAEYFQSNRDQSKQSKRREIILGKSALRLDWPKLSDLDIMQGIAAPVQAEKKPQGVGLGFEQRPPPARGGRRPPPRRYPLTDGVADHSAEQPDCTMFQADTMYRILSWDPRGGGGGCGAVNGKDIVTLASWYDSTTMQAHCLHMKTLLLHGQNPRRHQVYPPDLHLCTVMPSGMFTGVMCMSWIEHSSCGPAGIDRQQDTGGGLFPDHDPGPFPPPDLLPQSVHGIAASRHDSLLQSPCVAFQPSASATVNCTFLEMCAVLRPAGHAPLRTASHYPSTNLYLSTSPRYLAVSPRCWMCLNLWHYLKEYMSFGRPFALSSLLGASTMGTIVQATCRLGHWQFSRQSSGASCACKI